MPLSKHAQERANEQLILKWEWFRRGFRCASISFMSPPIKDFYDQLQAFDKDFARLFSFEEAESVLADA